MTTDMLTQIRLAGLPEPLAEYPFHPERLWRFDLAWPAQKVAAEREGGGWVRGRHHRPAGYEEDARKYAEAAILGWLLVRYTPAMEATGEALALVERALAARSQAPPPPND